MLAIIGGSGLTRLSTLAVAHREVVRTPYGDPSSHAAVRPDRRARRRVPRPARARPHDPAAPGQLPRQPVGAEGARARARSSPSPRSAASADCGPGDLVLPHQLIDYTSGREATFFDGGEGNVVHVDFTHPYTPELRERCLAAAAIAGIALRRRRRLRRGERTAPRDRGRDRPHGARRRDAGRHDRHARGRARARARACRTSRSASSSTTRRAAATARRQISMEGISQVLETGDGQGTRAARPRRHRHRTGGP